MKEALGDGNWALGNPISGYPHTRYLIPQTI